MTNSVEFAASFLAVAWLGGIPVFQNSQFGQGELEYIVTLTKPRGILFGASKPDPITDGLTVDAWRAAVTDSQLLRGDGAPGR